MDTRLFLHLGLLLSSSCLLAAGTPPVGTDVPDGTTQPALYHQGWIDFNKNQRQDVFEDRSAPIEARIEDLLRQMTLDEKTAQLATLYGYGRVLKDPLPTAEWKTRVWKDGIANIDEMHNGIGRHRAENSPYLASPAASVAALNAVQRWFIEETRLGIPVEFTNEGIRGACYPRSTNFPSMIALGASWNRKLVGRVFDTVARESLALGYRNIYAPIVDLARDPRWGRVLECFGEEPYLVTELSLATTRALQSRGAISTAKHFAVYSEPKGGRDGNCRTDPHVAPREMEMLHLRPWERLVKEGGLLGVMSSYNDYDGVPISGSREFLVERLRGQWGFRGYVVSDSQAVEYLQSKHRVAETAGEAAAMFVREGGNVRCTFEPPENFLGPLRAELAAGRLDRSVVDERVRDVLRVKFIQGLFDAPFTPTPADDVLRNAAARSLALEAARQSLVLLRNRNNGLPLDASRARRILVCGPTAKLIETSYDRYGSSAGPVVSVFDGVRNHLAGTGSSVELLYAEGCAITDPRWPESELYPEPPDAKEQAALAEATRLAAGADAIILCLGDSSKTVGESLSRTSLDLPGRQNELAQQLIATGKPVIVVLLSGRPATINAIDRRAAAVLQAWFPGEAGGTAVAEALFGKYNPGGRLPLTFPRSVGQLPYNFPYKPGSQVPQRRDPDPNGFGSSMAEGVIYPFGHGLSYTTFSYSDLHVEPAALDTRTGSVVVKAAVTNSGTREGDEVVQLYFRDDVSSVTTYDLNLGGFTRIHLAPGESRTVSFTLPVAALELIDRAGSRVVEPGSFTVFVGASSTDLRLTGRFTVPPQREKTK